MPTTREDMTRNFYQAMEAYFRRLENYSKGVDQDARVSWRLSCFESGTRYADFIEREFFPLRGKRVLDAACAWGGHAVAFAARGGVTFAADLNSHEFVKLRVFARENNLDLFSLITDCHAVPFRNHAFDVIIALELIEHIEAIDTFAGEVARLLRPGGICILSTPARLRSCIDREPHYGLKGIAGLPLSWQRLIATKVFRRSYPYPITRQFLRAAEIIRPFVAAGLRGWPVIHGRLDDLTKQSRYLRNLAAQFMWKFIVLQSPERFPRSKGELGSAAGSNATCPGRRESTRSVSTDEVSQGNREEHEIRVVGVGAVEFSFVVDRDRAVET